MVANMTEDQLLVLMIKYLKDSKRGALQQMLDELHPYDVAQLYRSLPDKHHHKFLTFLTPDQIADLIQELDSDMQIEILHRLGIERSSKVMNLMDNDDLADLLNELSVERIQEFLDAMKDDESEKVQSLMGYDPETAGGLMTNQFIWIKEDYTVRQAVDKLKDYASFSENIYYLYVINEEKKLVGVVSYRDLLIAHIDDKIKDIMFNRVVSVPVDMDQEEVARTIERYDFIAIPVVDQQNTLLGIITVDDVIDVVIREANEDIEKLSASGKDIDFQTKALTASARRLPWLVLLLFIGLVSGSIISNFEETLEQVVALIFFMPMIAGMTGNTGTQSLAVVVRGIVTQNLDRKTIIHLVFRELRVGILIGLTCGVLIFVIGTIWINITLGFVVGVSLLLTLITGTLAGTIIPLFLYRMGVDPAVASGPLITTLNDIFSLMIYFGIATAFLTQLQGL
ncbi:magnesium transporter [Halalkalibacterium halodurans]|uniref:Magnesium transporter MgtE n=2 Tax=Halalkalibacterium halodurans TaxID=86665 RepID=A0A0M0KEM5_ALKHA|nr:magnesium transporter [Halalkalibacterium halodurans]MDY7221008.1 magnesium transporter [Halalkalibacterium halodurans]MDY7240247.1 magnesium transporter [Halalkalibacterium halodurans]MED3645890.1 magnesium transporter [Halalkalibacterium halodurans]MED4079898.1 magnesium transporter [Halalkalibacterium halodurans]MED4085283.1 magnesium transporter [Halalkalibacterium halodurans]